jgi:WhiB family redox-sensing transcriptional regulator
MTTITITDELTAMFQAPAKLRDDLSTDTARMVLGSAVGVLLPVVTGEHIVEEPNWQDRGLCAQTDPEAFFPEKGGSTRDAKKVCLGCDVRAECLEYALANDERFGIWGGLSERERRKLKKDGNR